MDTRQTAIFDAFDAAVGQLSRNQLLHLLSGLLAREAIVRALIDEECPPGAGASSSSSREREVKR